MDSADVTFSAEEAVMLQRAMREMLGMPPERFPLPAFVGMISDEIEQLRQAGKKDDDIAAMIENATGKRVATADIARFYAPPESRHPQRDR